MIIIEESLWLGALQSGAPTAQSVTAVNDIITNVPLGQPASVDVTTNDVGAVDKASVELYTLGG